MKHKKPKVEFADTALLRFLGQTYVFLKPFIPWVSLSWGLLSAFFISRSISHPGNFLLGGAAFIAVSLIFQTMATRQIVKQKRESEVNNNHIINQTNKSTSVNQRETGAPPTKKHKAVAFGFSLASQSAAQYILLFILPFLFIAKQWTGLCITSILAITTLWDPWWESLHRKTYFHVMMRLWAASLLISALCATFLSSLLEYYFPLLAITQIFASQFWNFHQMNPVQWRKNSSLKCIARIPVFNGQAFNLLMCHLILIAFLASTFTQWKLKSSAPFPVVGVWLKNESFTFGKPLFAERENVIDAIDSITSADFSGADFAQLKNELCCVTPLFANPSFAAPIAHTWKINGKPIETIQLPIASGNGDLAAFRTFSCKKYFGSMKQFDEIECVTTAAGIRIGIQSISIKPQ